MIFAISSIWKLFFMRLGSVELMGLQRNIFYLKTLWWNSLDSFMKYYLLFEKCFSVLLEYVFEKWFESPSPIKKAKKPRVFEQFFTDPSPEGGSAKVPPAGSHFGRYFCTPSSGGRWSRAPVSAEMIKLRRSEWLCRTGIGCTGKELCPSPRSTIHPPMPQCTYQDTYQHTYQPTRNLLAHPATHPSHLPNAQKKSLNTLNFKTNCGPWLEWQPSFVPCMDIHGFLCLPNRL